MPSWIIIACVWLLLGLLCDRLCEKQAKKEGRRYEASTAVACYIAGPALVPFALVWAFFKALAHMVRH